MLSQRKFVDKDLEYNPKLIMVAVLYAANYSGEFEVMICAREAALAHQSLPIPVARMVLNCMRVDPAAINMLPETPGRPVGKVLKAKKIKNKKG